MIVEHWSTFHLFFFFFLVYSYREGKVPKSRNSPQEAAGISKPEVLVFFTRQSPFLEMVGSRWKCLWRVLRLRINRCRPANMISTYRMKLTTAVLIGQRPLSNLTEPHIATKRIPMSPTGWWVVGLLGLLFNSTIWRWVVWTEYNDSWSLFSTWFSFIHKDGATMQRRVLMFENADGYLYGSFSD